MSGWFSGQEALPPIYLQPICQGDRRAALSVVTEALATAITQWVLTQLYDRLGIPDPHRERAIITGIKGELHQVGANVPGYSTTMVGDLVADARRRFGSDLHVIVGGAASRGDSTLAERVGAESFASDILGAVTTLRSIA